MRKRCAQEFVISLLVLVFLNQIEGNGLSKEWSIIDEDLVNSTGITNDQPTYLWPLPKKRSNGNVTVTVDPNLGLVIQGIGHNSSLVREAFARYKNIILTHHVKFGNRNSEQNIEYSISKLIITVSTADETLQLGIDESYSLYVPVGDEHSIVQGAHLEAKTVYGALRGLETFSQLCSFNFMTKNVEISNAPWFIQDKPRFAFRGLLLDTSRHYQPVEIIKQIIDSMSYAKLNVFHWHIVDEESFPLEIPSFPGLWKGSYTGWERYTFDDAHDIVEFAKSRGINVMAEIDVPGHAESWELKNITTSKIMHVKRGVGYPDLWPSADCREPLDVSKNFTFEVIASILADFRKIFPFKLFHLGGDEVHTDCWTNTPKVKEWLDEHNMTARDAYQYFVLRAQKLAINLGWTPVNWEETFNAFSEKLNPKTIIHNWLDSGVCPRAVGKGFKCIFSNQGVWYLDHLDVPWEKVYSSDPLEGIDDSSQQKLVIGGEVCMWGETADASDVQQTIWPRAAAAAERLWSSTDDTSSDLDTVLPRLEYFRCLLNQRGIPAAPVRNELARRPPSGFGSCYMQ
ncbi:beta-hexosaminidase 1 isoform X1 [Cryptomeria japonica]|uniref:beta-hexosaminidase 1 isoform X1 n=1 Tax=Cryptomeria japonica TaxID=3369 RepID=UPI0027DA0E8D|nr:beta-hexosaminidase 1 isoform X1 [Cryptomeria japonica]XP_057826009.2 beta-hexosaminidase 1 isoform X1 [Cryptomeria japonica]XP_057826010.2 beta-hexosaminidase 1 isoform X1 [Cryptomeria japonica]